MKLNDRQIKNAKPTETGKKTKLFDGGGLYFEVTPAGGKIFRLKYRIDGKEKTFTIGKYPTVSLVEARQAAENARRLLVSGETPAKPSNRKSANGKPPPLIPLKPSPADGIPITYTAGKKTTPPVLFSTLKRCFPYCPLS